MYHPMVTLAAVAVALGCCDSVVALVGSPSAPLVESRTLASPTGLHQYNSYYYNRERDFAVCFCAKCGSTSFSKYLYRVLAGEEWPYSGMPWVQNLDYYPRWGERFRTISGERLKQVRNTFALMRDPKERLISAFKSKISCNSYWWNTDIRARNVFVPELLELAGLQHVGVDFAPPDVRLARSVRNSQDMFPRACLSFDEFMKALETVHDLGKEWRLNGHFRPQQFGCFRDMSPSEWTKAAFIGDPSLQTALDAFFQSDVRIPHTHFSRVPHHGDVNISGYAAAVLDKVTRAEYDALRMPRISIEAALGFPHASAEVSESPYFYLEHLDMGVCICAKCDRSMLARYFYRVLFDREWPYTGRPWVSKLDSSRWEGKFKRITAQKLQRATQTLALIRDPIDRLVEAFKETVSCDLGSGGRDGGSQTSMVAKLLELTSQDKGTATCFTFDRFAEMLLAIHRAGHARLLPPAFRPQQLDCFRDMAPQHWTVAGDPQDRRFVNALATALHTDHIMEFRSAAGKHSARLLAISEHARAIIEEITRGEYEALGLRTRRNITET